MAMEDKDLNKKKSATDSSSKQAEDLKKLNDQLNRKDDDDDDDRKGAFWLWFKRIGIILLILVLLAGIGVAIYFFAKNKSDITGGNQIKLSTKLSEELDLEEGPASENSIYFKKIYPGNKFPVVVGVRNADSYTGDPTDEGENIYIRYKISLIMGGVEYTDVVMPTIDNAVAENWHIYNQEEELESYSWDGFYYYYGFLKPQQSLNLFNEIAFSFEKTTNEFGGKSAQIVISVEAIQADIANLGTDESNAWNTAPRRWINNMKKGVNNQGGRINN